MTQPRAVLDTNVLISALLFEGECSRLVPLWKQPKFVFLLSKPILDEYIRALAYPKFQLTEKEIKALIEEDVLPFAETIVERKVSVPRLKDRDDEKFLVAAVCGKASHIVSGDRVLLELKDFGNVRLVSPADFLKDVAPAYLGK